MGHVHISKALYPVTIILVKIHGLVEQCEQNMYHVILHVQIHVVSLTYGCMSNTHACPNYVIVAARVEGKWYQITHCFLCSSSHSNLHNILW